MIQMQELESRFDVNVKGDSESNKKVVVASGGKR
jgi:hypothetical protein